MMTRLASYVIAAIMASLLLASIAADAGAQQHIVAGTLDKSASTEEGSPGWEIRLDEPVVLGGLPYDIVEVSAEGEDLAPLSGRRVSATGTFVQWRTPARGRFIVLEICEITGAGR